MYYKELAFLSFFVFLFFLLLFGVVDDLGRPSDIYDTSNGHTSSNEGCDSSFLLYSTNGVLQALSKHSRTSVIQTRWDQGVFG